MTADTKKTTLLAAHFDPESAVKKELLAKRRQPLVRGGSRLRVAKALTGEEAVLVLKSAGILTPSGKLSRVYR